jgi:hypothetical protein
MLRVLRTACTQKSLGLYGLWDLMLQCSILMCQFRVALLGFSGVPILESIPCFYFAILAAIRVSKMLQFEKKHKLQHHSHCYSHSNPGQTDISLAHMPSCLSAPPIIDRGTMDYATIDQVTIASMPSMPSSPPPAALSTSFSHGNAPIYISELPSRSISPIRQCHMPSLSAAKSQNSFSDMAPWMEDFASPHSALVLNSINIMCEKSLTEVPPPASNDNAVIPATKEHHVGANVVCWGGECYSRLSIDIVLQPPSARRRLCRSDTIQNVAPPLAAHFVLYVNSFLQVTFTAI